MKTLSTLQYCALHIMFAVGLLALTPMVAHAQSYDPYTSNAVIAPAPLAPAEFGGTGTYTFQAGNNGGDALIFPALDGNPGNLMGLEISLANGVPNVPTAVDPDNPDAAEGLSALSGPLLDYFDFTYNPVIKTYTGVQKAEIPAFASFEAVIQYRVTVNTFIGSPFNGGNVNAQPPGYTNPQPTDNDQASSNTYVKAIDYGDAPISYGSADHTIDLVKTGGVYQRYIYLGTSVDPEDAYQDSATADGDDINQTNVLSPSNDENGVTFPTLIPGEQVSIPFEVTIEGAGFAFVNAWIDWNGDGDFADTG